MDLGFLALVLAVLLGTYVFLFGFLKKVNEWRYVSSLGEKKHSLPPGDMGWPMFGNMGSFLRAFRSKNPDTFIYDLVKRYGRTGIYKTYLFGSPSIIVSIPETCRKVLADDERFGLGYPVSTKQLTGKKSFHSIPNSEHKRLRRLTTAPINGHEALAMYIGYIEDIVINSLDEWASMKEPIELLKEMRKVAFKVITHIFVGSSAESILGTVEKHYTDLNYGLKSAAINIPGFAFYKALKKLQDEDIIDLLLMFLLAGHESSAHAAMWAIIYLHDHPEILQKAKEEQVQILKKRPSTQKGLTLKDIREMNYLQKVTRGYLIPKGWKVLVWNRGVHMDPEVYSNPKEFIPARWENHTPKAGSFLPFGAGSRICPGADLAKLEISIFLHYFLLNYKLEQIKPGGPMVYLPLPRPVDNCLAKVTKVK
ncbi:Cytochrome P450 - like 10 [Theobroma cacao]|nr:Cytochrome P450 - like 10 [Theobroma cacao]